MDRKEFLSILGMGATGLLIPACLGSCSKDSGSTGTTLTSDVVLDLNSSTYSSLKTKGSAVTLSQGIIVAYGTDGKYYAVQAVCPHESGSIGFNSSSNKFSCNKHVNTFSTSGTSDGQTTNSSLKSYTTSLSGTTLTIKAG